MARADLILNLVKAGSSGDQVHFRKAVEALAADERAKQHTVLADRILGNLSLNGNGNWKPQTPNGDPKGSSSGDFLFERSPSRGLDSLILPEDVEVPILELVEEQLRSDLLRAYNLEPRNRVLLAGPPGNGKTSLAEALADALSVPFLTVRYEAVIGSYLGETAQRISQVFDHARSRQCVLFFDEFDAVAKERGDTNETGEIKRVVSSLLLQIDALPSYVVAVTASNHPELLDRAVWRRFQIRLELPMPGPHQILMWLRQFESRTGYEMDYPIERLAGKLQGLSFAEVEDFGLDVVRRAVLSRPETDIRKIVQERLRQLRNRVGEPASS
jgi:SpoVK/Ycf46/Vps4 family AAA+-type ATPase